MSSASTPRADSPSGSPSQPRVLGPYEILGPIAAGGMSVVYLARRTGLAGFRRLVAVKVCRPELRDDPEFVRMFLTEARLAAAIHHPNVVPILEVQREEELYLVMDYVSGASLQTMIAGAEEGLPVGVALRIAVEALRGLHAAHELRSDQDRLLGVVHRDVSPHNVLVGADGRARITDFGVARAAAHGSTTAGHVLKGKIGYMAPEQLRHEGIDRRVDVFAAGVVLWEALTGERLFRGDTPSQTMSLVLSGPVHPPSMMVDGVPAALDEVILRALARDVDTRFESAGAFADALEGCGVPLASPERVSEHVRAAAGREIERLEQVARSPGPSASPEPEQAGDGTWSSVRARRSRSELVWAVAVALLLGALGVAGFLALWPESPRPEAAGEVEPAGTGTQTPSEAAAASAEALPEQAPEVPREVPATEADADGAGEQPAGVGEHRVTSPERPARPTKRRRRRPRAPAAPPPQPSADSEYMPTGI